VRRRSRSGDRSNRVHRYGHGGRCDRGYDGTGNGRCCNRNDHGGRSSDRCRFRGDWHDSDGLRRGSDGTGPRAITNRDERSSDGNCLILLDKNCLDDTSDGGGNLSVDLVGRHLH
jgi:hypothetical protein